MFKSLNHSATQNPLTPGRESRRASLRQTLAKKTHSEPNKQTREWILITVYHIMTNILIRKEVRRRGLLDKIEQLFFLGGGGGAEGGGGGSYFHV